VTVGDGVDLLDFFFDPAGTEKMSPARPRCVGGLVDELSGGPPGRGARLAAGQPKCFVLTGWPDVFGRIRTCVN